MRSSPSPQLPAASSGGRSLFLAEVFRRPALVFAILGALLAPLVPAARAEWAEERYPLVAGWNSIWLSLDCGHADLDGLLAAYPQIEELWLWNALVPRTQFSGAGETPTPGDAWLVWRRGQPAQTTFSRPVANAAYLVKVATGAPGFTLSLVGRPVLPRVVAQSSGVNFVGFPVRTPAVVAQQNVERFFAFDAAFSATPELFRYVGGPLSEVAPQNPRRISALRNTALERGRAYWVNSTAYSEFYGPLRVSVAGEAVDFGADRAFVTLRIRNVVAAEDAPSVGFTLARRASVAAPAGQPAVAGGVPLLVRGLRDAETLDHEFTPLPDAGLVGTLGPGEETEIVLSVDRSQMSGAAGTRYASVLQVTDSLNLTRVDLAAVAVVPALEGVWVGAARVAQVDQIVGRERVAGAAAPGGYELRLIVHRAANGQTTLLQKVFLDRPVGGTARTVQPTVTTGLSRISSAAFPLDLVQPGTGQLRATGEVVFPVVLAHNAPTNPFLHTYHPDHDGLDARFASALPAGREAPTVSRSITLAFDASADNGEPGWGATVLGGTYRETITGLRAETIEVAGVFVLRRVSDAAQLTNQP